jgi:hypothetical protein
MRKFIRFVLFSLLMLPMIFCKAQRDKKDTVKFVPVPISLAEITFEKYTIDLGTITFDKLKDTIVVIKFRNTGKELLMIYDIKSSGFFDWVGAKYKVDVVIKPGQYDEIVLGPWLPHYGEFKRSFTVTSNAKTPNVQITVCGNVVK